MIERDLEARHHWLLTEGKERLARISGDPDGVDVQVAGWWAWGMCAWIGSGWCRGDGSWRRMPEEGWLQRRRGERTGEVRSAGVMRQVPYLDGVGRHLNVGIERKRQHLQSHGRAMNRRLVDDLDDEPRSRRDFIASWIGSLAARFRDVRVCSGDWARVVTPSTLELYHDGRGIRGTFLDPPYNSALRARCYSHDDGAVASGVRAWCLKHGADARLRIALCGYAGEHDELERAGWTVHAWKANGGYGSQSNKRGRDNAGRERIWFSLHCLQPEA